MKSGIENKPAKSNHVLYSAIVFAEKCSISLCIIYLGGKPKGTSKNLLHGSFSMTRETLIKSKSPRSNGHTHGADFDTLRYNQRIPCIICVVVKP